MAPELSNSLPDAAASSNGSRPLTPPSSPSPPLADIVVRPFTSQGSSSSTTSASPAQPHPHAHVPPHSSDRPSTARGSFVESPTAGGYGPYASASARTSYTRVDVDSLPAPVYPPLPPLPAAFAVQEAPVLATAISGAVTSLATTAVTTTTATMLLANGAQQALSVAEPPFPQTLQVSLTFLLVSGLRKTQSFEPETTVGRVKELVWNAWPARDADWQDERPPAPSYLRILYLGKILQDDETLLRVGFPTSLPTSDVTPTIVHLSIRSYALPSDDPALSKKRRLSVAMRRLSTMGGGGDVEPVTDRETSAAGCCAGCVVC